MKTDHLYRCLRCLALIFLAIVLLRSPGAHAAPITLTIDTPDRIVNLGSTTIFTGTITNHTGAALAASDLFLDFSGYDPAILSFVQLLGSPDFMLLDNGSSGTVDLFSVAFDPAAALNVQYFGDVQVQTGDFAPVLSNLVTVSVEALPEPGGIALMGMALLALLAYRAVAGRRRKEELPCVL